MDKKRYERGDIVWADLGNHKNSHIQSGRRPCIIVSTDKSRADVYTVLPGTCKNKKNYLPVHTVVDPEEVKGCLGRPTTFMAEQLVTIDDSQILIKSGKVKQTVLERVKEIIIKQLDVG